MSVVIDNGGSINWQNPFTDKFIVGSAPDTWVAIQQSLNDSVSLIQSETGAELLLKDWEKIAEYIVARAPLLQNQVNMFDGNLRDAVATRIGGIVIIEPPPTPGPTITQPGWITTQPPSVTQPWRPSASVTTSAWPMSRILFWGAILGGVALGTYFVFFRRPQNA